MMTSKEHWARWNSVHHMRMALIAASGRHFKNWSKLGAFITLLEPPTQIRELVNAAAERECALWHAADDLREKLDAAGEAIWKTPYLETTAGGHTFVIDFSKDELPF